MDNLIITDGMKKKLLSAMKWLTFLNIIFAIGEVSMVLGSIFCIGTAIFFMVIPKELNTYPSEYFIYVPGFYIIMGVFILLEAIIFLFPLIKSFKYVKHLRIAFADNSQTTLEVANDNYCTSIKSFGISYIVLYALIFLLYGAIIAFVLIQTWSLQ